MAQILSNAEENTLVRWISRLTITGFPATPMLVKEMADENSSSTRSGRRQTPENIQAWFDAFRTRLIERKYELDDMYNMDETGFGVGTTQSTRIIVDSTQKSNWKVTAGKQEWITAFECVNAAGKALSPMVIFKAQNTNSAWIPKDTPQSWQFSTSTNGWTSNSHGLEWLKGFSNQNPRRCQTFNKALADNDSLASPPTRRYAKRMTRLVESQNAEIALLRKQLADAQEVIETRKKRTKGKRVKLQGQFVFSSEEVLKMVREAEDKPKEKKATRTTT
ncbi:hypothetical protein DID88_000203 [Monilinia fructigena]|uniref:HTH CENPB-type domain-containing protein n=1 Tax=Monilinia fructigena TaxID=38457 RepID=A0A395ILM7_9HELO|nr:hypothetical protein DID88_000203 [Monilinia fructigena]